MKAAIADWLERAPWPIRYTWQLVAALASIEISGLSFPAAPFRGDEGPRTRDNLGLDKKDADGRLQDGVQEALRRIWVGGRFWHDLKNLLHEWLKSNPKIVGKFLAFLIVLHQVVIGVLLWVCFAS